MTPKLELNWTGKDTRAKLEPRILLEDPEKSYHARRRPANTYMRAASHGFSNEFLTGEWYCVVSTMFSGSPCRRRQSDIWMKGQP